MKIKESSGGTYILWIMLVVGCLLMCGGIGCAIFYGVDSLNYVEVQAVITDISVSYDSDGDAHHYVTVDYEYNGVQYNDISISFWSSDMYEGQNISIMCHKDYPTKLQYKTLWIIIPCILFGVGALFTLVISFPLHKVIAKNRGSRYARKHGEVLLCKITAVEPDTSYRVNGRIVNNIVECMPLGEETARYVSNPFSMKYSVAVGSTVKLYRDRNNHANYYVDLSSIENSSLSQSSIEVNNGSIESNPDTKEGKVGNNLE